MEFYEISPLPDIRVKARSPVFYWMRIVLFAWVVVHLSLVAVDQVAGDTETLDVDTATDDLCYGWADPMVAVCPSNRWYVPYVGQGDLNISWSDDNGTTWNHSTIVEDGWKGETHMSVVSIQAWSNNTTVVMVRTEGADHAFDLYLFWLWGENDPGDPDAWNYTSFADYSVSAVRYGSMCFNRSGVLYLFWNEANSIRKRTWNIADGTLSTDQAWLPVNGWPSVQVDHNDDVWIAFQDSAASGTLYVRDVDQTVLMSQTDYSSQYKWGSFFITGDNTKVLTGYHQYLTTHKKQVTYESVTNTTLTVNTFASNTDSWKTGFWTGGNTYGEKTVSVVMLRIESGSEEYVEYKAAYDAIDATWESSETVLWTVPTDDDIGYHYGHSPISVWPKIDNISTNRMTSGRLHYWLFKDEQGASDDYYDMLYLDDPTFPWWNWSAPEVPEEPEEPVTTSTVDPTWWTSYCSSGLLILVVLFVLVLVIVAMVLGGGR